MNTTVLEVIAAAFFKSKGVDDFDIKNYKDATGKIDQDALMTFMGEHGYNLLDLVRDLLMHGQPEAALTLYTALKEEGSL